MTKTLKSLCDWVSSESNVVFRHCITCFGVLPKSIVSVNQTGTGTLFFQFRFQFFLSCEGRRNIDLVKYIYSDMEYFFHPAGLLATVHPSRPNYYCLCSASLLRQRRCA